jgi:hypothetical protein
MRKLCLKRQAYQTGSQSYFNTSAGPVEIMGCPFLHVNNLYRLFQKMRSSVEIKCCLLKRTNTYLKQYFIGVKPRLYSSPRYAQPSAPNKKLKVTAANNVRVI